MSSPTLRACGAVLAAGGAAAVADLPLPLVMSCTLSALGCICTEAMATAMIPKFLAKGLLGIDLNKPSTKRDAQGVLVRPYDGPRVPEAMGLVSATVYLVLMFFFLPVPFLHDYASWGSGTGGSWGGSRVGESQPSAHEFYLPAAHLSKLLCALLAICCMCFLGFADNVLDLRWRDRLWLPLAASLPLLIVYARDGGGTLIVLPKLVAPWLGSSVTLGGVYYAFMAALAIFCTNSINILAGVNGLEVGQSVVVAATIVVNNIIQLCRWPEGPLHDNNLFSLYLVLPFLGCSLGLLYLNWYPSAVFVGDTYCYFAGMTFAVAGILGHNTKTVLLFFVPQLLNFAYSIPQLFRLVPCPRHRMPGYVQASDTLTCSFAEFDETQLSRAGQLVVCACRKLRLARFEAAPGGVTRMSNMTIINLALHWCGDMREDRLTSLLLACQLLSNGAALLIRYKLAGLFYDVVQ